jgi:hypothetical protein
MLFHKILALKKNLDKTGLSKLVLEIISSTENEKPDTYRLALHELSCVNIVDRRKLSRDLFRKMRKTEYFSLKESDYSLMIKIECFHGKIKKANKLLLNMRVKSIEPHYRTYLYLFEYYCKNGSFKNILDSYEKLRRIWFQNESLDEEYMLKDYRLLLTSIYERDISTRSVDIYWHIAKNFVKDIEEPIDLATFNVFKVYMTIMNFSNRPCKISEIGKCSECLECLESLELPLQRHERLLDKVKILVSEKFKKYVKKINYDCVIDAANVGYSQVENSKWKNFLDHNKVESVRKKLVELGLHPLIVIHKKYIKKIPKELVEKWKALNDKRSFLFETPYDNDDDWYWLYAVLYKNQKGLFVVTNDEMRDHYFESKDKKGIYNSDFNIFRERHQAKFELKKTKILGNDSKITINCKIKEPPPYSTKSQINGYGYHIPVLNNETVEWHCIYN